MKAKAKTRNIIIATSVIVRNIISKSCSNTNSAIK